ncbi:MAG: PEGA domain-containing protein [Planctomycetes bacterium]|nr:PEGA domain-containing protein [Planctomycetota bacterium]
MRRLWVVLLALLVGCQSVTVHSAPYGAEVFVDGERVGRTPCKFKASTVIGCEYVVEVKLPGYRPYVETVETEWGPGTTWNLLSSLIFLSPLIILTPFFGDVVPGAIFAPLEPEPAPTAGGPAPHATLADEEVR